MVHLLTFSYNHMSPSVVTGVWDVPDVTWAVSMTTEQTLSLSHDSKSSDRLWFPTFSPNCEQLSQRVFSLLHDLIVGTQLQMSRQTKEWRIRQIKKRKLVLFSFLCSSNHLVTVPFCLRTRKGPRPRGWEPLTRTRLVYVSRSVEVKRTHLRGSAPSQPNNAAIDWVQ